MDKMKLAHEMALEIMKARPELMAWQIADRAWKYADAMQAEAEKRNKAEAAKQSAEVHDLIGKAHFHYCENGACVHCGKSEKTIDDEMWRRVEEARAVDQEEWQPDWNQAPEWANWWAMDADGDCYWFENKPEMMSVTWLPFNASEVGEALSFGYTGNWQDSLRERPL